MLSLFPHEPAPLGVQNTRDRISHIKQVLQDTANWQRLGSLTQIEEVAGRLHRCRCGGDLSELSDTHVELTNLLRAVDVRVTQCWNKFASLQSRHWSQGAPAHIETENHGVIGRLLAQEAEPLVSASRDVRRESAGFRGLPNLGNTCYVNTALTALACSRGVPEAIDERLSQLQSQAQTPVTTAQSRILRNLQRCIQYVKAESHHSDQSVDDALNEIRQDLTAAGFTHSDLTNGAQHDAAVDVLFPLLANCLPTFCPENAVLRYSVPTLELDAGMDDHIDVSRESGLIRIALDQPSEQQRVELFQLMNGYFASHSLPGNGGRIHQRTLGEPAPDHLVIALDRARQEREGVPVLELGPDGYDVDRQRRSDIEVGLPHTGVMDIDGHLYHIEAMGLHHPSGAPDANVHTHGGHYTSFIPERDRDALGVGTHFSDRSVTVYSDHQRYDHANLERNVTFLILRKI